MTLKISVSWALLTSIIKIIFTYVAVLKVVNITCCFVFHVLNAALVKFNDFCAHSGSLAHKYNHYSQSYLYINEWVDGLINSYLDRLID